LWAIIVCIACSSLNTFDSVVLFIVRQAGGVNRGDRQAEKPRKIAQAAKNSGAAIPGPEQS
jgi:hypothetical protein